MYEFTRPAVFHTEDASKGAAYKTLAYATWRMSHWELQIAMTTMFMPIILSGVGSGLVFPTMSGSTLACVERERIGYAASLYNMVRNSGRQQVQSYLAQRFTPFTAYQDESGGSLDAWLRITACHRSTR